jgi:hypothetical protein
LDELKQLEAQGLCFNFVTMVLSGTSEDDFMEIVMEKGGKTLREHKTVTISNMREILFQVI